jgi:hypothetical protein
LLPIGQDHFVQGILYIIIPREAWGRKGEKRKGKGVGIGKEFDKVAAIILMWAQRDEQSFQAAKGGMRCDFPPYGLWANHFSSKKPLPLIFDLVSSTG